MFSHAATDPALSDKKLFPTLVRVSAAFSKMSAAVDALCDHFGWRTLAMVSARRVGQRDVFCDYAARSIEERFRFNNRSLAEWIQFPAGVGTGEVALMLDKIQQRSRSNNNEN